MIESTLYQHLQSCAALKPYLTAYAGAMAIFNQEAPADKDPLWMDGPQYGRIIFYVEIGNDAERDFTGTLAVDVQCKKGEQVPEELEPLVRAAIDGYFFSPPTGTMAAQWKASDYFTEPTDDVAGVTITFSLLAFPMLTTDNPDVIDCYNRWTMEHFPNVHVIGHDRLPAVWKPTNGIPAVYWRVTQVEKCGWIPDTFHADWQTATVQGHVMAPSNETAGKLAHTITTTLTAEKRIRKPGDSPLIVDRGNRVMMGADPMQQGQITSAATYCIVKCRPPSEKLNHIYRNGKETAHES